MTDSNKQEKIIKHGNSAETSSTEHSTAENSDHSEIMQRCSSALGPTSYGWRDDEQKDKQRKYSQRNNSVPGTACFKSMTFKHSSILVGYK